MSKMLFLFTKSQAEQILSLIEMNREDGTYNGRLDYWLQRNNNIEHEITKRLLLEGILNDKKNT